MQEKRQTSYRKKFPIIYLDSTLKEVEYNFPPLNCGLYVHRDFPKSTVWKELKKNDFTVEKSDKQC